MLRAMNRWIVLTGAMLVQLCLGGIYAWSVFVHPLEDLGFTRTQTQMVFSVCFTVFSIMMMFAGRIQDRAGPRKVAMFGGVLLGLGYIITGFLGKGLYGTPLVILTILSIGILSGAGMGIAYVCPVAAAMKWFPKKRGLITGLTVTGFGAGSWLFVKIASFTLPTIGVLNTFIVLGVLFLTSIILGSLVLVNPPNVTTSHPQNTSRKHFSWQEMIRTKDFWLLWVLYSFSVTSGLMVVGNIKPFGISHGLDFATAASAVGVLALFNGAGRIFWGAISDRIGRIHAILFMVAFQGTTMLVITQVHIDAFVLMVIAALVGLNLGGNFALFPSTTADLFGTKNLGANYGVLMTAFGTSALISPVVAGYVFERMQSYNYAFFAGGILCWVAALISFWWIMTTQQPVICRDK
jgi:MFS transporter, OFA family, oxalate/formate antiporter